MTVQIASSHFAALRRWRRLVAAHPRERAGLGALVISSMCAPLNGFVPLEAARVEVLCVEKTGAYAHPLRYAAYGGCRYPHGVSWGGIENNLVCRNLRLKPRYSARGNRFSLNDLRGLNKALALFLSILDCQMYDSVDHIQVPRVWAAVDRDITPEASGPELNGEMHLQGLTSEQIMARCRRLHDGYALYPADYVDDELETAPLYVEIGSAPLVQIVQHDRSESPLVGFRGSAMFDFTACAFQCRYHSNGEPRRHD